MWTSEEFCTSAPPPSPLVERHFNEDMAAVSGNGSTGGFLYGIVGDEMEACLLVVAMTGSLDCGSYIERIESFISTIERRLRGLQEVDM